jgi:hypothetical protein
MFLVASALLCREPANNQRAQRLGVRIVMIDVTWRRNTCCTDGSDTGRNRTSPALSRGRAKDHIAASRNM